MLLCGGEVRRGGCGNFVKQFKFCHKSYEMFPRTRRYWQAAADSTDSGPDVGWGEVRVETRRGEEQMENCILGQPGPICLIPSFQPAATVLLLGQARDRLHCDETIIICLITNSVRSHDTRSWSWYSDLGLAITLFSPLMITGAVSPLSSVPGRVSCRNFNIIHSGRSSAGHDLQSVVMAGCLNSLSNFQVYSRLADIKTSMNTPSTTCMNRT